MNKILKIVDNHCDTLVAALRKRNWTHESQMGHWDIPRFKRGGGWIQVMAICTEGSKGHCATAKALQALGDYLLTSTSDDIVTIKNQKDLKSLSKNKVGIILAIEGADPLQGQEQFLEAFYKLGVRLIGLTWKRRNELADGVRDNSSYGLSNIGKEWMSLFRSKGIAIDVSHLNEAGFWDVIELADDGILASHSNAASLLPIPRNLTDDQLKAISDKKGIIGINFSSSMLGTDDKSDRAKFIEQVARIKEIAGAETLSFGGDLDGLSDNVIKDASQYSKLLEWTSEILSEEELERFAWKNSYEFYLRSLPE